ncbi:MAG: ureidoglycolate lyase [Stellaceae bacterium]|jgi:ureidoglycolate hydrolase
MNQIAVAELSAEAFAAFGEVGAPLADGSHAMGDVALDLAAGTPRFYIMRLTERGPAFEVMARHDRVTQCLGAVDGMPWLIAVAPAGIARPGLADIRAFRIPADRFLKLGRGTWHAGPYFDENQRDFYNLELIDTNTADYTVCRLSEPVAFAP